MAHRVALEKQIEAMATRIEHRALVESCRALADLVDSLDCFDALVWREYRLALKALGEAVTDGGSDPANEFLADLRASIRHTEVLVTVLTNSRNAVVGLGVKITSDSESTRLIKAEMLVDSIWHIYLPGRGSLFIEQTENFWSYAREVIAPAYWSSADNWKGVWNGNTTAGPGALGTARVIGGSGEFSNRQMAAVEALSARVYSVENGPLAMDGHLTIELRSEDGALASEFAAE